MNKSWIYKAVLFLILPLVGCTVDIDEESAETFSKLKGTWETYAVYDSDGEYINGDPGEDYHVVHFSDNNATIITCKSPDLQDLLNVPIPYTLKGNQLDCMTYWGDFNPYYEIEFSDDGKWMRWSHDDSGQGYDLWGEDYWEEYEYYYVEIFFKRVDTTGTPPESWTANWIALNNWEVVAYSERNYEEVVENGTIVVLNDTQIPEYNVKADDENYHALRFYPEGQKVSMILSNNPKQTNILGELYPYTLEGNQLTCKLFEGTYADFVTVEYPETNTMVITLEDNGSYTDEKGIVHNQQFTSVTTYHRIKISPMQ